MFRGNDQDTVGAGQLAFETHDFWRQIAFMILVEHRQIVDAHEICIEFAGAAADQRLSQSAVDGVFAIAADDQAATARYGLS